MPGGRPLKFKSVEELEAKIADYFSSCEGGWIDQKSYEPVYESKGVQKRDGNKYVYEEVVKKVYRPAVTPTISGLAVYLDTSRETLLNYEEREEFFDTIKRAKQTIEAMTESLLLNGGAQPAGVIFNLKNNWGWKDKVEQEITGGADPVGILLQKYQITEGDNGRQDDEPVQSSSESHT